MNHPYNGDEHYRSLYDIVWLAFAPPGVVSSGPQVISGLHNEIILDQYRELKYTVLGPYRLEEDEDSE